MARGGQRKADGPSKKATRSNFKSLPPSEIEEIPPMPKASEWVTLAHILQAKAAGVDLKQRNPKDQAIYDQEIDESIIDEVDWSQPVKDWWVDIWSSPMSNEFVHSDIHGLYMACFYFEESLNPHYKPSDRIAFAKQFENSVKNYGLNPSARESLRWQVSQGQAAQQRTSQLRAAAGAGKEYKGEDTLGDFYEGFG